MMKASLFTINSKKTMVLAILLLLQGCFTGCGQGAGIKIIEKTTGDSVQISETEIRTAELHEKDDAAAVSEAEENISEGFYFDADGIDITTDINAADILKILGEPQSYFEAASCAFEGLDKYYTYEHYEIDTYPDGDDDYIASIVILDDLITTKEGLAIGQTREDALSIYGNDYEENGSAIIYTINGTHLSIVFDGNIIRSITYDTSKLDSQE